MIGVRSLTEKFHEAGGRAPEFIARAPGRIEFIGNHTDYNGGTVLGASIDRAVWVALARRPDGRRRFRTDRSTEVVERAAADLGKLTGPGSWVNYPLGVLAALPEFGLRAPAGFDFLAGSDLPVGAGLSSSAAIELASGLAFLRAAGEDPPRETLVHLCRHAENHFVGVPSGILDQGVSGFGRKGHLVFIDCRGPRFDTVPLPAGAHFWIFNTHTKHALVDGLYAERHRECMEAARWLGVELLADVTPGALAAKMWRGFPARDMASHGREAHATLLKRAKHVVEEIARVDAAVVALRAGDLPGVGRLLTASHRSSQLLFENSTPELDFLVDALASQPQVFGARLTGGGFGGAVMALTDRTFNQEQAAIVAAAYGRQFGAAPDILHTLTANGAELVVA
jgi:galactokinase